MRADQRSSSRWRRRTILGVAAATVGLFALWGYHHWRLSQEMNRIRAAGEPTTLAELADFHAMPPEVEDTTDLWMSSINILGPASSSTKRTSLPIVGGNQQPIPLPGMAWDQLDEAGAFLADFSDGLKLAHQATKKGAAARFPNSYTAGFAMQLPTVKGMQEVARMLQLEANVRAHRGDAAGVADSLRALLAAAETFKGEPLLLPQMVRCSIAEMAHAEICRLVPHLDLSDADLADLQGRLRSADYRDGLYRGMIGERTAGIQVLQHSTALGLSGPGGWKLRLFGRASLPMYLKAMRVRFDAIRHPLPEAIKTLNRIDRDEEAREISRIIHRLLRSPAWVVIPRLGYVIGTTAQCTVKAGCADCALAAIRYHKQHGRFPAQLSELVPDFVPAVPVDPFDGQPIRYRQTKHGFLLYSVGHNTKDEGGIVSSSPRDADIALEVNMQSP